MPGSLVVLFALATVQAVPLPAQQWCGDRDGEVAIQQSFDGLRVCASASGLRGGTDTLPSDFPARASLVVLETQLDASVRQMRLSNGGAKYTVDGSDRPIDAAANEWRSALLAVLDVSARRSTLRGSESALRSEISAVHGERNSLLVEIAALRGEVSAMHGEIEELDATERRLVQEISAIQQQQRAVRRDIAAARSDIMSLQSSRSNEDPAQRARIQRDIQRHQQELQRLESTSRRLDQDAEGRRTRLATLDPPGRKQALEQRIREFDLIGKVAAIGSRTSMLTLASR